ncbi:MAG: response regulator transcription factor [Solobacterium sp.]|nr:response regulator transcription factor [Solobacterium sp.]
MKEQTKRIYIADDDDHIREIIKTFLDSDGYETEVFERGDLLLGRFAEKPCDLVILDVMMPGPDGFAITSELRKTSTVPIILLTARDSENDLARGLVLGSDDYITKPFSAMALLMRIRAIFRRIEFEREKHSEPRTESVRFKDLALEEDRRSVLLKDEALSLTPTEYEVLKYLILHANQAVSRKELLETVWGFETAVETRATDDTVRRLRQKITQSDAMISAVWGYGFRLEEKK